MLSCNSKRIFNRYSKNLPSYRICVFDVWVISYSVHQFNIHVGLIFRENRPNYTGIVQLFPALKNVNLTVSTCKSYSNAGIFFFLSSHFCQRMSNINVLAFNIHSKFAFNRLHSANLVNLCGSCTSPKRFILFFFENFVYFY